MIQVILLILFTLNRTMGSYEERCNVCVCYHYGGKISMDCRNRELFSLPTIERTDTFALAEVYMNNNNISLIDTSVMESWTLLRYIDLRDNPLICTELTKIPDNVLTMSDCEGNERGEFFILYSFIYLFIYLFHL